MDFISPETAKVLLEGSFVLGSLFLIVRILGMVLNFMGRSETQNDTNTAQLHGLLSEVLVNFRGSVDKLTEASERMLNYMSEREKAQQTQSQENAAKLDLLMAQMAVVMGVSERILAHLEKQDDEQTNFS